MVQTDILPRRARCGKNGAVLDPQPAATLSPPGLLGKLLYHCLPIRRGVILENLRRAFGKTLPRQAMARLAQAHYAHLARLVAECLVIPWVSPARRRAMTRIENLEALFRELAKGKGVLFLTGHLGNWEIVPQLLSAAYPQQQHWAHVLRRPLRWRWLERVLARRFRRHGFEVLPKEDSVFAILRLLREGRPVVFVMDQHASRREGVEVELFGQPVSVFKGLALAAERSGAPVMTFQTMREPDGTHVLRFGDPLPAPTSGSGADRLRSRTQSYLHALERLIRQRPEQWLWMHRLWKGPRQRRES
jgi:KDO2-lipid IV(A) lauroyltransferase